MIVEIVVEIPKGSRNKYEYDEKRKKFRFDRTLFSSMYYPADYGFIDETHGEDNDALDALVFVGEPTFPGCIIAAYPIGALLMSDDKGVDSKILCVPESDPLWNHIRSLDGLPPHLLREIEHFFTVYKDLEGKKTVIEDWADKVVAERIVQESKERYLSLGD